MQELLEQLQAAANPDNARVLARYFQVKPGGYGEGDVFLGIKLGELREIARPYCRREFVAGEWLEMLRSPIHEHRLICLVVMSERAARAVGAQRSGSGAGAELGHIYRTYLANTRCINNWDLVDVSGGPVVGGYLLGRDRSPLYRLARSPVVWERRIAMVSTQRFIREGQTRDVYQLAQLLLSDPHDLMHKAVGWMLREAGKRVDAAELRRFLSEHATRMPRTMLRYAVEHFEPAERQSYLAMRKADELRGRR
ncbi:MAG: DNA alkylation repair protein [Propionibacteriaceae bacterium]|nr:DNA alkylation repair protein [Propionibacteriaceae bacterium]